MRFEGTNEGEGTGRLGALQPPLSCYICWCSNSVSKKWQDNFSGKYITTNEGNYWWLSIEAGSPIGTEERLHWGRNILPSSLHSFLSSYELGTFTSCFHLHIKFQQNPKVVLWRNTKPNTFVECFLLGSISTFNYTVLEGKKNWNQNSFFLPLS